MGKKELKPEAVARLIEKLTWAGPYLGNIEGT